MPDATDFLVRLVALAGDQHGVAALGFFECQRNCASAVALNGRFGRPRQAGDNLRTQGKYDRARFGGCVPEA